MRNSGIVIATVAGVVLLDRASKATLSALLAPGDAIEVIPGFFNIVHVTNRGAAFGMLKDSGDLGPAFLAAVSMLALAVMGVLLVRAGARWVSLSLSLMAAGAMGNLVDRLMRGEVFDFLDFHVGQWHWPAFNVADSAITIGVGLYIVGTYLWKD